MADKEIADLTDGGAAAAGDLVHAVRGVNSRKIVLGAFAGLSALVDGTVTFAKLATAAVMSSGNYAAATAEKLLTAAGVWADNATFALTDAATIAIDLNAFVSAAGCALGGNRTLGNPTNADKPNQHFTLWFTASGGTRTLALGTNYKKGAAVESFPISIAATETVGVHCIMRSSSLCVVTGVTRYTT